MPNIQLQSATTQTAPFSVGHAFKAGDIPAGQSVVCAGAASFHADHKNVWPDGSLKFAVLSGTAALTAGAPLSMALTAGAANVGAPLTLAALKATGIVAAVDAGALGSASWAGTDWDAPDRSWVSGPVMSSWLYRKPVGSDAHLAAWLEVRLFASGAVEVLPWIENGYLNVAAPSNKSETYSFSLGGTQRASIAVDLKHHQRTPLINGAALSYWLGADPGVVPLHDRAYLQATELVPTYSATPAANAVAVTGQVTAFAPLQAGGFVYGSDSMAQSGYQTPIGLLPEHDMIYLVAPAASQAAIWASVQRNGYSAGRYGIHYRDESTQRPPRFSQWPNMVIRDSQGFKDNGGSTTGQRTPAVTGGNPPQWDIAHSPSVGFMAYLLTGRCYFMEEAQFAATCNYLGNGNNAALRDGSKGLVQSCLGAWQTRSAAWMWRHLAQALCVTPDADAALRNEFITSAQHNIDHYHGRYVAQPNNPFGIIQPGETYNNKTSNVAIWQQDFFTAAWGYSMCMGLPLSAEYVAKMASFFSWKAKSTTGRLGSFATGGWPYGNADVYAFSSSATGIPDYASGAGPWRASFSESWAVAAATLAEASSPSGWLATADGVLAGEIMPGAHALWGNFMPGLAYARRHGVPGAQVGYERITSASNYGSLAAAFNTFPVWSVQAASVAAVQFQQGRTLRISPTPLYPGKLVIGNTGHGMLGADIRAATATGDHGPGPLVNDLDGVGDDNVEIRAQVLTRPSAGTFFMWEDGSFELAGAPAGTYTFTYRLWAAGQDMGTTTATIVVGGGGGGTISVTSDMPCTYNVRGRVTSDMGSSYNVRAAVVSDLDLSFNVRAAVISDMPCVYQIAGQGEGEGPVLISVTSDMVCSVNILGRVVSDMPSVVNILSDRPLEPTGGFAAVYRLPTNLRRTPRTRLPSVDPHESVLVSFDFGAECLWVTNPRFEVIAQFGTDDDPETILTGRPLVQGAKVFQRVAGGLDRVRYGVACIVDTDDGDTLVTAAVLPVRSKHAR